MPRYPNELSGPDPFMRNILGRCDRDPSSKLRVVESWGEACDHYYIRDIDA